MGFISILFLQGCQPFNTSPIMQPEIPSALPTRTIGQSTLNLDMVWRFQTGRSNGDSIELPNIYLADDKVIISYMAGKFYGDEGNDAWLTALSIENGQIIWQTRLTSPWGTWIESYYMGEKTFYLVFGNQVHAFDLDSGKLLWTTPNLGDRVGYVFRPWDKENPLLLYVSTSEVITIDPISGTILSRQPENDNLIYYDNINFISAEDGLYAVDSETGNTLWHRSEKQPLMRQLLRWPSFLNNDMIFETGAPCFTILRVNIQTGQIIWATPERNYLSNFAISGSQIFALREDTTLVALNLNTGTIEGMLKFDGESARTICTKSGSDIYSVVSAGSYILVYMGDTQELIALRKSAQ